MAVTVAVLDVETVECEIRSTYARGSEAPDEEFIFPTGRARAEDLAYPRDLLASAKSRTRDDPTRCV